ncbi:uncharacterized protein LOC130703039 [Daphnia carinata]|uniref:uncharacterized protein LOC130703039 n=1 Tax=Daphnia carinata TaxID=120202 RepID=UPI00257B92FC|nr:uncharacterized protein LOC130703039 [Daphnia carinata]
MSLSVAMEAFVYDGDQTTLSTKWPEWLRRFENYLEAMAINDDNRKKALLLHLAGKKVHQIFVKLNSTPREANQAANLEAETQYAATKRALNEHFNPRVNITYNRHKFKSTKQASDESLDQFHTRLSELAQGCDFRDVDDEIKSQIILTCTSTKLRAEALVNSEWDLKTLLEKGTTYELTKFQSKQIEEGSGTSTINKIVTKKKNFNKGNFCQQNKKESGKQNNSKTCTFCGGNWHKKLQYCPAKKEGVVCGKCHKEGHFARICRHPSSIGSKEKKLVRNVKFQDTSDEDSSNVEEFTNRAAADNKIQPTIKLEVLDSSINFLVDSGASVTLINERAYEKLGAPTLKRSTKKIYAYQSIVPLPLIGTFQADTKISGTKKIVRVRYHVISGSNEECLLSYCKASPSEE